MNDILITDDDEIQRMALSEILKAEPDWNILEANDGQAALDLLCDGLRPTLSIVDLRMPKLGGVELLQRIRRDPLLRGLHVVIASASRDRETVLTCSKLGIDGYLLKPYDAAKVLATIRAIMAKLTAGSAPIAPTRNLLARTALVVEDDPVQSTFLTELIKAESGWEVVEANTAATATQKLRAGLWPSLCLLDMNLPDSDGISWLQQIRSDPVLQKIRVVVLSAESDREKIAQLSKFNIAGFLPKPTTAEKLQAVLREAAAAPV